ncbi:MAG: hypothetical protein N2648_01430 [Aquificaceae bacterium]|nr:hypothetical protein [Aquificaceae bacterium]
MPTRRLSLKTTSGRLRISLFKRIVLCIAMKEPARAMSFPLRKSTKQVPPLLYWKMVFQAGVTIATCPELYGTLPVLFTIASMKRV